MSVVTLIILLANFITNSTVFQVVKEQIATGAQPEIESSGWGLNHHYLDNPIQDSTESETAFVDIYGDFEELINSRRERDLLARGHASGLGFARAEQIFTEFEDRSLTSYKISDEVDEKLITEQMQ